MRLVWFRFKKAYYLYLLRRKKIPTLIRNHLETCLCLDIRQPILKTDFVVFDTETTGLHAKKGDRIVSISALRLSHGRIDLSDTCHELINPNRNIPQNQRSFTEFFRGWLTENLAEEILPSFIAYIGSSPCGTPCLARHDLLKREMVRLYGFPIQNIVLDTVLLDQAFGGEAPSSRNTIKDSSLIALAERYDVRIEESLLFWRCL
jgi:DNA polymerase-3 subunit epsilon